MFAFIINCVKRPSFWRIMCTALCVETAVWENNCDTSVNDLCGDKQGEQTVTGPYYQSTTVHAHAFIIRVHLESLKLITRIFASLFWFYVALSTDGCSLVRLVLVVCMLHYSLYQQVDSFAYGLLSDSFLATTDTWLFSFFSVYFV